MSKFIHVFFYSNIFLGITAVLLCIEVNITYGLTANRFPFYALVFLGTCLYYTLIYLRSTAARNYDERTLWYRSNYVVIKNTCKVALTLVAFFFAYFITRNLTGLVRSGPVNIALLLVFPALAGWYTFVPSSFNIKQIRQYGWLKPFIVSITWAGFTTIYPVITWQLQHPATHNYGSGLLWLLFLQNLLFILVIAILFDLKDYRNDARYGLNTFAVSFGIRKTFRMIVWPVLAVNFFLFLLVQWQLQTSLLQQVIRFIPFAGLGTMVINYRQQKRVLYYLVAVDGWLFIKALTGIASILIF